MNKYQANKMGLLEYMRNLAGLSIATAKKEVKILMLGEKISAAQFISKRNRNS